MVYVILRVRVTLIMSFLDNSSSIKFYFQPLPSDKSCRPYITVAPLTKNKILVIKLM